jgi:hypothetical protein
MVETLAYQMHAVSTMIDDQPTNAPACRHLIRSGLKLGEWLWKQRILREPFGSSRAEKHRYIAPMTSKRATLFLNIYRGVHRTTRFEIMNEFINNTRELNLISLTLKK